MDIYTIDNNTENKCFKCETIPKTIYTDLNGFFFCINCFQKKLDEVNKNLGGDRFKIQGIQYSNPKK